MHHPHNDMPLGFTGVGSLMDTGFVRRSQSTVEHADAYSAGRDPHWVSALISISASVAVAVLVCLL